MAKILFFDLEVKGDGSKIVDIGAISDDNEKLHGASMDSLEQHMDNAEFICGHNIIAHDLEYLKKNKHELSYDQCKAKAIDTLLFSPLFPEKPYHRLVKDDKLQLTN